MIFFHFAIMSVLSGLLYGWGILTKRYFFGPFRDTLLFCSVGKKSYSGENVYQKRAVCDGLEGVFCPQRMRKVAFRAAI